MNIAVEVEHVSKRFRLYHERNQSLKSAIMRRRRSVHEDFWALKDEPLGGELSLRRSQRGRRFDALP